MYIFVYTAHARVSPATCRDHKPVFNKSVYNVRRCNATNQVILQRNTQKSTFYTRTCLVCDSRLAKTSNTVSRTKHVVLHSVQQCSFDSSNFADFRLGSPRILTDTKRQPSSFFLQTSFPP